MEIEFHRQPRLSCLARWSAPIGRSRGGDQERGDAEVHPDECRACSRFDWWMPESQS